MCILIYTFPSLGEGLCTIDEYVFHSLFVQSLMPDVLYMYFSCAFNVDLVIRLCSRFCALVHIHWSYMLIGLCVSGGWTSRTAANWALVVCVVVKLRNIYPSHAALHRNWAILMSSFCVIRSLLCVYVSGVVEKTTPSYTFWSLMVSIAYVVKLYC